jgi:hypothetical protein
MSGPVLRSFDEATRAVIVLQNRLETSMRICAMTIVRDGYELAKKYSDGPVKAKDMRKDRPFAKWHPGALLPPDIINFQTGAFYRDWRAAQPRRTPDGFEGQIINDNPVTEFFRGTRFMWDRPIEERLVGEVADMAQARINDAVERLFNGYG